MERTFSSNPSSTPRTGRITTAGGRNAPTANRIARRTCPRRRTPCTIDATFGTSPRRARHVRISQRRSAAKRSWNLERGLNLDRCPHRLARERGHRVSAVGAVGKFRGDEHSATRAGSLRPVSRTGSRCARDNREGASRHRKSHPDPEPTEAEQAQSPEQDRHDPPRDRVSGPDEGHRRPDDYEGPRGDAQEDAKRSIGKRTVVAVPRVRREGQIQENHGEDEQAADQSEHEGKRNAAIANHRTPRGDIASGRITFVVLFGKWLTRPRGRRPLRGGPRRSSGAPPD